MCLGLANMIQCIANMRVFFELRIWAPIADKKKILMYLRIWKFSLICEYVSILFCEYEKFQNCEYDFFELCEYDLHIANMSFFFYEQIANMPNICEYEYFSGCE